MTKEITTIDHEATIAEVAKVMAADPNFEGYVIILKKGKPVGIITERDIVYEVTAKEIHPSKVKAYKLMSTPLITIDPDDDLLKVSELMREHNVTKLAVVKADIIYGVITAKDIAQHVKKYITRGDQRYSQMDNASTPLKPQ